MGLRVMVDCALSGDVGGPSYAKGFVMFAENSVGYGPEGGVLAKADQTVSSSFEMTVVNPNITRRVGLNGVVVRGVRVTRVGDSEVPNDNILDVMYSEPAILDRCTIAHAYDRLVVRDVDLLPSRRDGDSSLDLDNVFPKRSRVLPQVRNVADSDDGTTHASYRSTVERGEAVCDVVACAKRPRWQRRKLTRGRPKRVSWCRSEEYQWACISEP